jgi:hypothetical protein
MKKSLVFIFILSFFVYNSCKKNDNPVDVVAPVISLKGSNPVYVEKNTSYTDAGATAYDEVDGDISANIEVDNLVDVNVEGDYFVKYNVVDKAGNKATEVRRLVYVRTF